MSGWRWAGLTLEQREAYAKFPACQPGPRYRGTDTMAVGCGKVPEDSYFKNHVLPTLKRKRRKQ